MLILIAESKTMSDEQRSVSAKALESHGPVCQAQADGIMSHLKTLSPAELSAETGLSSSLTARMKQMIYEFPNRMLGLKAIEGYTGVVFKALGYDSLTDTGKEFCDRDVRIISSLYGVLRPDDIIKPYRLDFTSKAAPGSIPLYTYLKKYVTVQIVKTLQAGGYSELLNLLPGDAAKCIDWKIVKRFCKVWKVDFVEVVEADKTRTPSATKLKTMRGELLRQIITDNITDIQTLKRIKSDSFICEGTPVYPDHLRFLC